MAGRLALAIAALRLRPFARLLNGIEQRRNRQSKLARCPEAILRSIAGALHRTSFIASPLDRCLPRSLATAHRMLDRGIAPTLVLGVKLGPFEAHCWVQHGATLVNDRIDNVRRFVPIRVV